HVFVHKISGVILSNTDPLLLTYFISPLMTNVYNAYNMICSSLIKILYGVVQSPADSFGNLFSSDENHKYSTFLQYANFAFFLSSLVSSVLFITANDFVQLWMKESIYVLSYFGVFLFTMNTYYLVSREPLLVVRNVNGLFKETKKIALLSAFSNLSISLLLVKPFGIVGILLGTFLTHLLIDFFMSVQLVYPKVFGLSAWKYYQFVFLRTLIMFIVTFVGLYAWRLIFPIGVSHLIIWFIAASCLGLIVLIVYMIIYYILFYDFRTFIQRSFRLVRRKKNQN
ncbi:MAG: hypothetical protein K2G70_03450, partial [Turicibacter sp.]|nr:hypothetical protein [Turicibacter sp.]